MCKGGLTLDFYRAGQMGLGLNGSEKEAWLQTREVDHRGKAEPFDGHRCDILEDACGESFVRSRLRRCEVGNNTSSESDERVGKHNALEDAWGESSAKSRLVKEGCSTGGAEEGHRTRECKGLASMQAFQATGEQQESHEDVCGRFFFGTQQRVGEFRGSNGREMSQVGTNNDENFRRTRKRQGALRGVRQDQEALVEEEECAMLQESFESESDIGDVVEGTERQREPMRSKAQEEVPGRSDERKTDLERASNGMKESSRDGSRGDIGKDRNQDAGNMQRWCARNGEQEEQGWTMGESESDNDEPDVMQVVSRGAGSAVKVVRALMTQSSASWALHPERKRGPGRHQERRDEGASKKNRTDWSEKPGGAQRVGREHLETSDSDVFAAETSMMQSIFRHSLVSPKQKVLGTAPAKRTTTAPAFRELPQHRGAREPEGKEAAQETAMQGFFGSSLARGVPKERSSAHGREHAAEQRTHLDMSGGAGESEEVMGEWIQRKALVRSMSVTPGSDTKEKAVGAAPGEDDDQGEETMPEWRVAGGLVRSLRMMHRGEGGAVTGRVLRWRKGQSQSQLSAVRVCQAAVRRTLAARKCRNERAWEVARLREGVFRLQASSKQCLARRRWHCLVRAAGIDSYTARCMQTSCVCVRACGHCVCVYVCVYVCVNP